MKKILKRILLGFLALVLLVVFTGILFVNLSPQFGGNATAEQKLDYANRADFEDDVFINQIETTMDLDGAKMIEIMGDFIEGVPNGKPNFELPIDFVDSAKLTVPHKLTKIVWFGHSAFLVQIGGKTLLLDPMLTEVPAPHPLLGGKRFSRELPIEIDEIPEIDAIFISHDHYDHLDYESIQRLKAKTRAFYVPLGVGAHFLSWGVSNEQIHEMAWWEEGELDNLFIAFAPSRHFSGRGITDRNATLWGSWIIQHDSTKIYFSGDGGYGPHFKEIGERYGPFDFAMMECGQYNENWAQIHMMPEETAQAALDVRAKTMMPIHWGAFTLALHSWTDPIERVSIKAAELNVPLIAPRIGQEIILNDSAFVQDEWWVNAAE